MQRSLTQLCAIIVLVFSGLSMKAFAADKIT